jgi:hypothetical protein
MSKKINGNKKGGFEIKAIEFIKSSFLKDFFESLTWFGIIYLIFSAIFLLIFKTSPHGYINFWTLSILKVLILLTYILVITLIIFYQVINIFKINEYQTAILSQCSIFLMIFVPVGIDILLYLILNWHLEKNFISAFYMCILFILLGITFYGADLIYKKEDKKTSFLKLFLVISSITLYFFTILKIYTINFKPSMNLPKKYINNLYYKDASGKFHQLKNINYQPTDKSAPLK